MKKQTYLFQKFQKKYSFFQKSFFDFLYWRSTQNLDFSMTFKEFCFHKNVYPYEFEKMSFSDFSKKSELTKIKNSLENAKKKKKDNSNVFLNTFRSKSSLGKEERVSSGFKFKKASSFFTNQKKFHFLFSKKRKEKFQNKKGKRRKAESFLPQNSSFEIFQSFNFLNSKKIGDFFPKKKNFVQYWIFPFFGVLFFFSQNAPFVFFQKENKLKHPFFSESFQIQKSTEVSIFSDFRTQKNFFRPEIEKQSEIRSFEFSFPQGLFKQAEFFQSLEKTEYEELFQFYKQILNTTISFFPLNPSKEKLFEVLANSSKQSSFSRLHEKAFFSVPFFAHGSISQKNTLLLSTFQQGHENDFFFQLAEKFPKKLESKRNCLDWKWFSFDSNFSNPNLFFSFSSLFHIPQKAEFFLIFSDRFSSFRQFDFSNFKTFQKKPLTPLFDYSKSLFFLDEKKRDLSFFDALDVSSNSIDFSNKEILEFESAKENVLSFLKTHEAQKFLKMVSLKHKNDLFFSPTLFFKKKAHVGTGFASSSAQSPAFDFGSLHSQKNVSFLEKWAKTQKLSRFKNSVFFENENPSFFRHSSKTQPSGHKTFRSQKHKNLDFLFFEKFFQKVKLKNLQKNLRIEKFSKKEKRQKKFSPFKKYSFDFFLLNFSKKNYQKFYFSLCSKTKDMNQTNSLSFPVQQHFPIFQNFGWEQNVSLTLSLQNQKQNKVHEAFQNENVSLLQSQATKKDKIRILNLMHPLLFQFSENTKNFQKFSTQNTDPFFQKLFKEKQTEQFQTHFNLSPKKQNFFFLDQKDSQPSFFSFSSRKLSFFEKLRDELFQKNSKNFFFDFYQIENFQKNFLFETTQRENALFFHKKNAIWTNFSSKAEKTFVHKKENFQREGNSKNSFLKQSSLRQYELKKKKLFVFPFQKQNKSVHSAFSGSSKKLRKFEKIFRAFFSPFHPLHGTQKKPHVFGQKFSRPERISIQSPHSFVSNFDCNAEKQIVKSNKDVRFLQSLSVFLQKHPEQTLFFLSTNKKNMKRNGTQKKQEKTFANLQSFQTLRLSPELVFKRNGFLFSPSLHRSSKKPSEKKVSSQRLEKEKNFQKKRRLKKEKLETRRRKKRKRFFPRPMWLRMNLYKKFLKNRHSPLSGKKHFSCLSSVPFSSERTDNDKKENFYLNSFQKRKGTSVMTHRTEFFTHISTKRKKSSSWLAEQKNGHKKMTDYFHQKFHQKETLFKRTSDFQVSDIDSVFFKKQNWTFQKKTSQKNFQRESWIEKKRVPGKSLSLHLGISGTVQKENGLSLLQDHLKTTVGVQDGETVSKKGGHFQISNEIFQEFLRFSWKSSWFQNNMKTYTRLIEKNFEEMQLMESQKTCADIFLFLKRKNFLFFFRGVTNFLEQSQNDFLLRKSVFQKFSWYSNIQNSFSRQPHQFIGKKNNVFSFGTEKRRNVSEYNQILYLRVSELFKKFKFSENMANESFFEILKGQRRKNEKIFSGTQGVSNVSFFTKTALFFEKFQVPSQPIIPAFSLFSSLFRDFSIKPTGEIPTLRALWAFQKTNSSHFQNQNIVQNLWAFKKRKESFHSFKGTKQIMNFLRQSNWFEKFKAPEKFSSDTVFSKNTENTTKTSFWHKAKNSDSIRFFDFSSPKKVRKSGLEENRSNSFNLLNTMTLKKFQTVENKSSLFGIQSFKQNSKMSSRYFKYEFSPFFRLLSRNQKKGQIFVLKHLKNKNKQNSAKSSFNFWWAQRPFQTFDFFGSSQFQNFFDFSDSYTGDKQTNNTFLISNISFLVFGTFFFHFAIFYTLFKIPEIRSLFKFTFLLFSKFLKSFFRVFFSIYNIFRDYTQNGFNLFKNSSSFIGNAKTMKNSKKETGNRFSHGQFAEMLFSPKECRNEIRFSTSLFCFTDGTVFPFRNQNAIKKTKFDMFLFEFFPRFSSQLLLLSDPPHLDKVLGVQRKIQSLSREGILSRFGNEKSNQFSFSKKQENFLFQIGEEKSLIRDAQFQKKKGKKLFSSIFALEKAEHTKTEKNLSQFALCFLVLGKNILFVPYSLFKIASALYTKVFEIFENVFYAFYKFLEKPAEFMIEFIAFVFLIEWSSDILGFFPESIETSAWKSSEKLLRPIRSGAFFFSFGIFFLGPSLFHSPKNFLKGLQWTLQAGQNLSLLSPFHFLFSTGFFQFSNFATYVLQKRLAVTFQNFPSILFQPDIDILVRQRKGILFWDIWAEILLRAAEKYNVNLPSFVTLKEEQELFIEKLIQDPQFFENFESPVLFQKTRPRQLGFKVNKPKVSFQTFDSSEAASESVQKSFSLFLQNFLIQNRPQSFFDFSFSPNLYTRGPQQESFFHPSLFLKTKNNEKFQQFFLANLFCNQKKKNTAISEKIFTLPEIVSKPFFPFVNDLRSLRSFEYVFHPQNREKNFHSFQNSFFSNQKMNRWECSQYSTFQSQETDFFLDISPPKSLKHVRFLKYYEPGHSTLGLLICQIYAGLFPKQVSKNILVVGESGTAKTFFLRAIAGETEMKIITENASRYAIVQRGVAVGMKYLRDVFDSIALQTPCFFVMEDLHLIGSKRPFLLSETENSQTLQFSFGLQQQEVHETNQMIYQSTRHSVSDFRRPYKGDFSMGIPTNSFLQTFYSRVSKKDQSSFFYSLRKGHKFQNSQFFGGNFSSNIWHSLSSPLPIDSLEASLQNKGLGSSGQSPGGQKDFPNASTSSQTPVFSAGENMHQGSKFSKKIQSVLQFSKEQIFAPPATSPFSVLVMKEGKKLKPKKIVQETSWGGLSTDQILLYQKENSSIRTKIALLAEKTMNFSRGKFDMITDLLVIIDNVRSNRGFVVFGTTHKPSCLDPALRRPGRFDETLSFAQNPNFLSRFEIFKTYFENSPSTFHFFDSSLLTENFSESEVFDILSQTKLSFFHKYKFAFRLSFQGTNKKKKGFFSQETLSYNHFQQSSLANSQKNTERTVKKELYSKKSPTRAFHTILKSPFFEDFYSLLWKKQNKFWRSSFALAESNKKQTLDFSLRNPNLFDNQKYTILPNGPSHLLSLAYSKLGIFVAESSLLNDPTSFLPLNLDIEKTFSQSSNFMRFSHDIFYHSPSGGKNQQHFQLRVFLSGKIAEFMVSSFSMQVLSPMPSSFVPLFLTFDKKTKGGGSKSSIICSNNHSEIRKNDFFPFFFAKDSRLAQHSFSLHSDFFFKNLGFYENAYRKRSLFEKKNENFVPGQNSFENFFFTKIRFSERESEFAISEKSVLRGERDFYWTVFGNEQSWRSATPFLFSLIQKRFLFTKNLLLSKMLFFENMDQRRKPPNPPGSSIFMPSKKYENFKRTEVDFFQKLQLSIHEKIQIHQKQRFLKQLYNVPVQKYFRSQLRKTQKTIFSSSFKEFSYFDRIVQKSSSSFSFYKKYIQVRHRFSNVNKWWNGMFPEHTREATYSSDVDWRTMFLSPSESFDAISKKKGGNGQSTQKSSKKTSSKTVEFLMDFPDTEQYYNPRNRKWFFKSNSYFKANGSLSENSTFWEIFEKDLHYEIFSHFFAESFSQTFSDFEKKREMLDFLAFFLLSKGFLKEFDFLTIYSRF